MSIRYLCASIAAAITLSIVPSHAGPCSPEIDRMQARVDAMIAATAAAGTAGRESLVSVSKLLESSESFGFKGGGLIRGGTADVDA